MRASFTICVLLAPAAFCCLVFCPLMSAAAPTSRHDTSAESGSTPATAAAKLTFRRVFKSSTPELIEICVREDADDGTYEIRQLDDDPEKLPFEVGAPLRAKMFE